MKNEPSTVLWLMLAVTFCSLLPAQTGSAGRPEPTLSDVFYGPHARNVLDLWKVESAEPTPVVIFFHGGSFKAGDKSSVRNRPVFSGCLENGISVISANYRFSTTSPYPASMQDGARVVQFVRSKAREWGLNPEKAALSGSSAGGTLALWIALRDDMADPESPDPVSRLSTRVSCLVGYSAPASFDPEYIRRYAGVQSVGGAILQLIGAGSVEDLKLPRFRDLFRDAAPFSHISADDPPLWLRYQGSRREAPFAGNAPQNAWIHHVCLGEPLRVRYEELGLECRLYDQDRLAGEGSEVEFLLRHLVGGTAQQ